MSSVPMIVSDVPRPGQSVPQVTVVIPTLCDTARWRSLNAAIESALSLQQGLSCVIVVVNGNRYDAGCFAELKQRRDISVLYLEKGGLPSAIHLGRSAVKTPYFAFLDDDDEYLPGALAARLAPMLDNPDVDCVATNGIRRSSSGDGPAIGQIGRVLEDPLEALCTRCWLASCGGLYRSAAIGLEFFDPEMSHIEWTAIAYKIAALRRVRFLNIQTFIIHVTPNSLSGQKAYCVGVAQSLDRLLSCNVPVPSTVQAKFARKAAVAHLSASEACLVAGDLSSAWRHFGRSSGSSAMARMKLLLKLLLKSSAWPLYRS